MREGATLHARGLAIAPGARPIELSVEPGEIVGLAGLDGHGQQRFLRTLAGIEAPDAGAVTLERGGRARPVGSFRQAARSGIAYLPRDRRATGIFPTQSVIDNFAISTVGRDVRFGLISDQAKRARFASYQAKLSIVAPRLDAPITTLSGGNQQKVLLARALALEPAVLLLDDPTRGVDVATRHVLYDVFRELSREGMALVVLSSEIEEILALCRRVLVFREHEVAAEIAGAAMTTDAVIAAMFGRAAA